MGDARQKAVMMELADLYSRSQYLSDKVTNLREPLGLGDTIEIPSIGSFTVSSAVDGSYAPQNVSVQSVSTSILSLNANLEPAIFAEIPQLERIQMMGGAWAPQVAMQILMQLSADIDSSFAKYLAQYPAYDGSATYLINAAGDAITNGDAALAWASIMARDGIQETNLAWFMHPYAVGGLKNISAFIPQEYSATGSLGVPRVGLLQGVPVYTSNSVPRLRTVAASASAISSNVMTLTVSAGHGIEAGMMITTAGGTANVTTAAAVTSVTATTVVVPKTASNDAANGASTITINGCENLLVDTSHCWVAKQRMPTIRIVERELRTGDVLQASAVWGRVARAGRVFKMMSPASAVA